MNVYQQYKREQLALKIQRDIQADIDEEKRIKEAEIRMKEESRLQAIEEAKKDREQRIIILVVTILFLIFAKYIASMIMVVIIIVGILLGVIQMIFSSGGFK